MKKVAIMAANEHKPCYGTMFPDPLHATNDRINAGKVFSFVVISPPGLARAARQVEVNRDEWDDCTRCPEFDHCYKFCMAKLALETVVAQV
jgi:hypothetical protein